MYHSVFIVYSATLLLAVPSHESLSLTTSVLYSKCSSLQDITKKMLFLFPLTHTNAMPTAHFMDPPPSNSESHHPVSLLFAQDTLF